MTPEIILNLEEGMEVMYDIHAYGEDDLIIKGTITRICDCEYQSEPTCKDCIGMIAIDHRKPVCMLFGDVDNNTGTYISSIVKNEFIEEKEMIL